MRLAVVLLCAAGFCLAACQDSAGPAAPQVAAPAPIVKRDGVSLADATVALATLDGAPDAAAQDFRAALSRAIAEGGIVAVDKKPRYQLRLYLSASSEEGGASLDYVVDVYDPARLRIARLSDALSVKGAGDPWSLMSDKALDALAATCAEDVAAFLSNTPEAKPAQALSYAQ